ncbi:apoptosis-stimulating of p53 protein 1 isoform X5 [Bubalus kerabau]|uniref:apoptosis-stimulating of p53 protein 1 isoform X5 n=1 Tax=Bubalus carabanensis TaxID=3119969 RepID=UPI00244EE31A|nr:apoptosis-stimulating of p53 protein 1 isoform X5 [Bubalus carabanensis]
MPRLKSRHVPGKMILTVFLSNNEQILTEVPITPETTCRDVVEFCKEPGEGSCHLAEVWRGNERPIPFDYMMYEHLQKWGPRREEVKFFLRHEDSPTESSEQGGRQTQEQRTQRNVTSVPGEKRTENGVGNPRVELTLSELQDMAARQQQQIENQQQMLVAKEQRLHFLKQQERRQQQSISENEKLQKLKERVEAQENKLKKIRAMRGQVDYSKIMNGNLSAEIERFSAMFQEKKQEVQTAILRVDQLSQQLEDLKKGKLNGFQPYSGKLTGPAAVELKRLYQELQIRNQLNQEQNSKLQQQKELLNKRNVEVAMMDKRISELRERLYGKKTQLSRVNGTSSPQSPLSAPGRVAAVGPYIQVPSTGSCPAPGDPAKPQSLTVASSAAHGRSKSNGRGQPRATRSWTVSDLDARPGCGPSQCPTSPFAKPNDGNWPTLKQNSSSSVRPPQMASMDWKDASTEGPLKQGAVSSQPVSLSALSAPEKLGMEIGKVPPPLPGVSKPLPPSYGTYPSPAPVGPGSTNSLERRKEGSLPRPSAGLPSRQKPAPLPPAGGPHQPGSSQQIQQRISVPPSPTYPPAGLPSFPAGDGKPELPLTVAIRPFLADKGSRPQSPRKGPQTVNSSSIYSMYLQQATPPKNYQPAAHSTVNKSVKAEQADQPEEAQLGADGAWLAGPLQPAGAAPGRVSGGGVRPGAEGHLRGGGPQQAQRRGHHPPAQRRLCWPPPHRAVPAGLRGQRECCRQRRLDAPALRRLLQQRPPVQAAGGERRRHLRLHHQRHRDGCGQVRGDGRGLHPVLPVSIRRAGEAGRDEQRRGVCPVDLRGPEQRRADLPRRGCAHHSAAQGRGRDRLVVGSPRGPGGLRAQEPAGVVSTDQTPTADAGLSAPGSTAQARRRWGAAQADLAISRKWTLDAASGAPTADRFRGVRAPG